MAELFHFVAAAVELPVPRACATACKLAQLHALSRLCQYRPAGPPKMHAQNDTKMHSDECKGRSLRFCVRAEQRVCEQLWPQLSVSGLSPRLTSVRPMLSPSFVPPAGFRESGRGKEGKKDDDDVWDLRRKKKKKNRASRGLNVIFALFCSAPNPICPGDSGGRAGSLTKPYIN